MARPTSGSAEQSGSARQEHGSAGRVTVAIAHDDALVADILARACSGKGLEIVDISRSPDEVLSSLGATKPDVLLLGSNLDGEPIDELLAAILATGVRVIVVSPEPNPERLTALLSRGISGYLLYDSSPDEVAIGVQAVARGGAAISPTAAVQLVQQWRMLHSQSQAKGGAASRVLTTREREVLAAMTDGLPTKAIARVLGIAVKTVENHKLRIFQKLNVRTHPQAVTVALTYGLVADFRSASQSESPPE